MDFTWIEDRECVLLLEKREKGVFCQERNTYHKKDIKAISMSFITICNGGIIVYDIKFRDY